MDDYSAESSSLGGPAQFNTGKSKRKPVKRVSSFDLVNKEVKTDIKVINSTNTQLKKDEVLRIEPSVVQFNAVEPGVRYVLNISVRNTTQTAQRIRFSVPKTEAFSINYIPAGAIAPGLDVIAEVECQIPSGTSNFIFTDSLTVTMGPHKVEVPVIARKCCPDIVFDPFLNMGLLPENQLASTNVYFENEGTAPAQIAFKTQKNSRLSLDPSKGTISPNQKLCVTVKHDCKELGPLRELISVSISGLPEDMILDVSGQVVSQKLSLLSIDGTGALEQMEFGTLFYGQAKETQAILVNSGPVQVNFTVSFPDEADSDSPPAERAIIVSPTDGTLNPFSQVPITLRFCPVAPAPRKGFTTQYITDLSEVSQIATRANIDALDMGEQQTVQLTLLGSAVLPTFKLSPTVLRFGTCPLNDKRDILLTLQSTSPIPLRFDFSKGAQFKIVPEAGTLNPGQTRSIVATLAPCQLGEIKKICTMSVEGGLRSTELRIIGDCVPSDIKKRTIGGTDKLPEDFKPQHKFVDPAEIRRQQQELASAGLTGGSSKYQRVKPWESQEFLSSTSWDEVYESTHGGKPANTNNDPATYSLQELQRRANHKATYNEYVQSSYKKRVEAKAKKAMSRSGTLARLDPDGVDMGMERGLGDGPMLKVPAGNEPLWLANRGDKGDKKSFQFDENRLIVKKAREGPSTQAEQRDCSTELTPEELRKVVPSHKIMNFGKVCVNSVNVKNFAITNELQQMVLIKLGALEPELRQSKPVSQVAAAGGTVIGFDMHFVCREVCKYKRTFAWTVNEIHNFKVTVLAEVVPIEVVLDKQRLVMEFPGDSLEKSHSDKVVMTNPGNAVAEFVWGNRGAFRCVPEQGNLHPGQSMVVNVIWTPEPNFGNSEDISLLVTGGIEQALSLTGVLAEGKIVFEEKRLQIGTIAVGSEKKMTAKLKNIGVYPAIFFISDIPPSYHIRVKPDRARLAPEESIDIEVTVAPLGRVVYDNKSLGATVRGGKSINLKLAGEAVVPKVHVEQNSFDFGHVVTGSKEILPMTLVNSGTIDSVLFLDFTSTPEFKPSLSDTDDTTIGSSSVAEDNDGNILEHIRVKDDVSCKWRILIRSGSTMRCYLYFSPQKAKVHNFRLPLNFQGLAQDMKLAKPVTAEGLLSRLSVSAYTIDFQDRVVSRDPSARMSYYKEVTFKNVDLSSGLSYHIKEVGKDPAPTPSKPPKNTGGVPQDDQPLFFLSPTRGDLAVGESTTMRITFMPKSNGDFYRLLHVYISGQPDPSRPYFSLVVRGSGVYPRLSFSKQRIVLPPVPLHVSSRNQCIVYNQGYDNIELKYRVSPTIPVPLVITFPDGNELGLTREKVPMIISAKSDRPESWMGKVEFYDNDGEKFFLEVCGCADSSLLTVYPFVRDYSDRYGFLGLDEQPVRYCTKKEIAILKAEEVKQKSMNRKKAIEAQNSMSSLHSVDVGSTSNSTRKTRKVDVQPPADNGVEALLAQIRNNEDEGVDVTRENKLEASVGDPDSDVKMLLKWLNAFICRKQFDVDNYVDVILSSTGDIVIDCLEQLSGKKVASLIASNNQYRIPGMSSDNETRVQEAEGNNSVGNRLTLVNKLVTKYTNLLNFLTRSGALVMHISPLTLLDLEGCLLAREVELKKSEGARLTQAMLKERRSVWESEWKRNCADGWSQILFQAFKIFVLSRITFKDYVDTPGVVVQSALASESKSQAAASKEKKGGNKPGTAPKKKDKGPKCPPELQASNIYSQSEAVVLAWVAYHQLRAGRLPDSAGAHNTNSNPRMPSMNRRVIDLGAEFSDFFAFCQVIHSHLPDATNEGGTLTGYTFTEPSEKKENFDRFTETLNNLRMNFNVSMEELSSSSRCMMIMIVHLFLNVPHLLPKTTIEFKGSLSTPIVKSIELKNPSKKLVSYDVTLDGPSDFSIEARSIMLEPNSLSAFHVTCTPHFSKPTKGRLTFWGIRESGVGGSNIVFDLVSKVTDRPPLGTIKKNCFLFEHDTIEVEVSNPFEKGGTFSVQLLQQHVPSSISAHFGNAAKSNANHRKNSVTGTNQAMAALLNEVSGGAGPATARDDEEDDARRVLKDPFWCGDSSISLGPNETKNIIVHVLPFALGTYTCQVVMVEPSAGEFCSEIILNVGLPRPMEELHFESPQLGEGDAIQKVLKVASSNTLFDKAVVYATDARLPLNRRAKARVAIQGMLHSAISNEDTGQSQFAVEIDNSYFNAQKEFGLVCSSAGVGGGRGQTGNKKYHKVPRNSIEPYLPTETSVNSLPFSFFPERAGTYRAQVVMYSLSNQQDIRVLAVCAKITPSQTSLALIFKGHARQKVTQDIPLTNESEQDWQLQAFINGRGFASQKTVTVPSRGKVSFPVSFVGQTAGEYEGTLYLKNTNNTQDSFEFKLKAVADDPLCEGNLTYSCRARQIEYFTIPLPNTAGVNADTQVFGVETDLQYIAGPDTVSVGSDGGEYKFSVNCPVGGRMTGSITFKEKSSNHMVWYTVEIDVTSPSAESTIEAEAEVRKAVAVEITLDNPTDDDLQFDVVLEGEGLLGDNTFTLAPSKDARSAKAYELIFSPLKAGKFVGSITFMNDIVGEFWYKVLLNALPASPTVVPLIECMVGTTKSVMVAVENPLAVNITLVPRIEDKGHFAINPENISLGPYAQSEFELVFCPSSLYDVVSSEITLSNSSLGDLTYHVSGKGLLPGNMPTVNITSPMNEIGSRTILFRNPFPHPLPLDVVLKEVTPSQSPRRRYYDEEDEDDMNGDAGVFSLLLRKSLGLVIAPDSSLQAAISFSPKKLGDYHATAEFRATVGGRSLLWCYPVCGIAEAGVPLKLPKLSASCKSSLLREISVPLEGLMKKDMRLDETLKASDFNVEVVPRDPSQKNIITRTFRVQPLDVREIKHDAESDMDTASADFAVHYRLLFEPLRVFAADVDIIVVCKNKGRWRAEIELEAQEPPPDDVINLKARVGESDKVSFRLTNRFLGYSPFEAYFTARSSPHFTVSPSSGVLAPFGSLEGTQFIVTFSPKEYGIRETASLVVSTAEAQWNYQINGAYPDFYIDRSLVKSKVDSGKR